MGRTTKASEFDFWQYQDAFFRHSAQTGSGSTQSPINRISGYLFDSMYQRVETDL
jgi:hypothetical protein